MEILFNKRFVNSELNLVTMTRDDTRSKIAADEPSKHCGQSLERLFHKISMTRPRQCLFLLIIAANTG